MYTTVDRVKARMSELQNDTALDDVIDNLIRQASSRIDTYCQRKFERATHVYEGFSRESVYLPNTPVVSVEKVERRASPVSAWTVVDPSEYGFGSDGAFSIQPQSFFSQIIADLRISYTGGYLINFDDVVNDQAHTLPRDITGSCELLVVRRFQRRNTEGLRESHFDTSESHFDKVFDTEVKEMLDPYKSVSL